MEFTTVQFASVKAKTPLLVIFVSDKGKIHSDSKYPSAFSKQLSAYKKNHNWPKKPNEIVLILEPKGINAERVLLVCLDMKKTNTQKAFHDLASAIWKTGKAYSQIRCDISILTEKMTRLLAQKYNVSKS